tara:strand:- start:13415 stop:13603 length:189 start_codon:yes stop_codon:yes gene_type:complete
MNLSEASRQIIIDEFIKLRDKKMEQNKKLVNGDCPLDVLEDNIEQTNKINKVLEEIERKDKR